MTKQQAQEKAARLNKLGGLFCTVSRILPVTDDPPSDDDNGWDVFVSVTVENLDV